MKLLLIAGTRPEIIKCAPVYMLCRERGHEAIFCNTGQHRQMSKQAFQIFRFEPELDLDLMKNDQSINEISSRLYHTLPSVLSGTKPDFVLVQGDTSTAAISALIAFNMKYRVAHIEAGLRTYNKYEPFPEEVNRRLIGLLSSVNFCPTELCAHNLLSERIIDNVVVVGNTIVDSIEYIKQKHRLELPRAIHDILQGRQYVLITAHRRESFGQGIENICEAIAKLAELKPDVFFIYSVHPNPNIKSPVMRRLSHIGNVLLIDPVDYISMLSLVKHSLLCMTDSGGIQEEAPSFNKYTVILRNTTERIESVNLGYSYLVGTDTNSIVNKMTELLASDLAYAGSINPYGDGKASGRIIDILERIHTNQSPSLQEES